MAIEYRPDWTAWWTADDFERELGIKFNGPGSYESGASWLIAIPADRPPERAWHQKFDENEKFHVHVYNDGSPANAFNLIINAPQRTCEQLPS